MEHNYLGYFSFYPKDEYQWLLLDDFRRIRAIFGEPHRFAYLRAIVKTRSQTRTVYPPDWKYR